MHPSLFHNSRSKLRGPSGLFLSKPLPQVPTQSPNAPRAKVCLDLAIPRGVGFPPCPSLMGFPGSSDGKESSYSAGDPCSIPGLGRSPGWEDPLKKGMATHSSILAWRIRWTEEPGRLQSTGWQRIRHDRPHTREGLLATNSFSFFF